MAARVATFRRDEATPEDVVASITGARGAQLMEPSPELSIGERAAKELGRRGVQGAHWRHSFAICGCASARVNWVRCPSCSGLALIWTYFELQDEHFLTARNLSNLVLQISVSGTIAVGVVLVLLLGEIDLSVGSVAGATAAVLGVLVVDDNWPWWAGVLAMLVVGALIGAFHGVWFAILRVPSFVVTLAGLLIWLGVQLHVLGDAGTLNVFDAHITAIASTFLPHAWGWAFAAAAVDRIRGQASPRRYAPPPRRDGGAVAAGSVRADRDHRGAAARRRRRAQ